MKLSRWTVGWMEGLMNEGTNAYVDVRKTDTPTNRLTKGRTDGWIDGRTVGRTNGRTDGRTDLLENYSFLTSANNLIYYLQHDLQQWQWVFY